MLLDENILHGTLHTMSFVAFIKLVEHWTLLLNKAKESTSLPSFISKYHTLPGPSTT